MIIIAIAIKLDSTGPVIFKQVRTGKYGKNFKVWKFRTMAVDNDVRDFSKENQHTKVGTFLRKTSLDELPQLFCILSGKMSFIGPRPWITDYYDNMKGFDCIVTAGGRSFISQESKLCSGKSDLLWNGRGLWQWDDCSNEKNGRNGTANAEYSWDERYVGTGRKHGCSRK